jgi:DNA polymerase (family X)
MDKEEIAQIFEEIATLLELKGDNPFRIRAYRNAARTLLSLEEDLQSLVKKDGLKELKGIGRDLSNKIATLSTKGRLPFYEKLKRSIPKGVVEMMGVHGLGGKKIKALYEKLHINSLAKLKKACVQGHLSKLSGFGKKTEQNLLNALIHKEAYQKRHLWWDAIAIAEEIKAHLSKLKGVKKIEIVGSLRRKLETIGDIDLLIASPSAEPIMKAFISQPSVAKVIGQGETKASIKLDSGIQADLRIVPEKQFGFAMAHLTGSKEHNIRMRELALKKGWSLSEYGLIAKNPQKKGPFDGIKRAISEREIYEVLGLSYIEPEMRENLGELEAAAKGKLPTLITEADIRGTFHNHTTASDGRSTLNEMVRAAEKLKWEYIGIADHSKSSVQANGLKQDELLKQVETIRRLNASKKFRPTIFAGVECDILASGALDFPASVLKHLDYVVISVHNALSQDEKTMTRRIIRAIENPYTTMVGHITGRLLLQREPYKVNLTQVIDACIANGKIMEINANPKRLDMDWRYWHGASEKGLMCCINTDAHHTDHLEYFRAGVNCARKGWLRKADVLNTRSLKEVKKILRLPN